MVIHTVKKGETVDSIARKYNVPSERIIADNLLTDPNALAIGQALVILFPNITYTVRNGDTLLGISERVGVPLIKLWQNNPLLNGGEDIVSGQTLNILYPDNKRKSVISAGYTFPDTDREILKRTLPYLSRLYIYTYGLDRNGKLLSPEDSELISLSKTYDATPIMVISPIDENGNYNNNNFNRILLNEDKQRALIREITDTAKSKGYGGVNTSFEFLSDGYDDKYEDFLNDLRNSLDAEGIFLTVEVAPDTRDMPPDDDSDELVTDGDNEDGVILTTFEITDKANGPAPIFPINFVENAVNNAVRKIDSNKILLGMPNFGYVWKLESENGEDNAQSVSNTEAVDIAVDFGAEIDFDDLSKNPNFTFTASTQSDTPEYKLWFEDARTVKAALDIINNYNLQGFAVWNIRRYFPQLWAVLNSMFNIIKE